MAQFDCTTKEQSKRLLELGLPADSADMYYQNGLETPHVIPVDRQYSEYTNDIKQDWFWVFVPCWSVGRLLKLLLDYSTAGYCEITLVKGKYSTEYVLKILESMLKYHFNFKDLTNDLKLCYESKNQ